MGSEMCIRDSTWQLAQGKGMLFAPRARQSGLAPARHACLHVLKASVWSLCSPPGIRVVSEPPLPATCMHAYLTVGPGHLQAVRTQGSSEWAGACPACMSPRLGASVWSLCSPPGIRIVSEPHLPATCMHAHLTVGPGHLHAVRTQVKGCIHHPFGCRSGLHRCLAGRRAPRRSHAFL